MAVDVPPLPTPTTSRRIAAIASWITIVGAGVVLMLLLISDPLTMVGAAASLAAAVAAVWNALTRRAAARLVSAAVAVVAVVVCIVVLLAAHDLVALFASLGLAIAAVALGRYSLSRDRASLISAPTPGVPVPAATKPVLIMQAGEAAMCIHEGALVLYHCADEIDAAAREDRKLDLVTRARMRLDCAEGVRRCLDGVEILFHSSGSSGIRLSSPLTRAVADLRAINQHGLLNLEMNRELYGRVLLGVEQHTPLI